MKILWASNAPFVGSGYGVQTSLFAPRLAELGHDLALYANWGVQGGCLEWNGLRIYPADGCWGNRTLVGCAAHHGDGEEVATIALCDAWVLDPSQWPKDFNISIWAPVDHHPLPLPVREVLSRPQVTPIAMSRFGEQMMRDANLDPVYVPHGIETDIFTPRPEMRDEVRNEMNLPADVFVIGIVAANQGSSLMHRKAYPQMFQAFARFHETHRDAVLYVHTSELPREGGGLALRALATDCGIPRGAVVFTEAFAYELGWPRQTLADAYQAFDVLLSTSMGEGFGVPIIEAQASGVPVIVTDHSAMTELCGAGWLVQGEDWYDGPQRAWFKAPYVGEIVDALESAYNEGDRSMEARRFALQYDADTVTEEFWRPALDRILERETVTA